LFFYQHKVKQLNVSYKIKSTNLLQSLKHIFLPVGSVPQKAVFLVHSTKYVQGIIFIVHDEKYWHADSCMLGF
jgi:hypothetical protein